MYVSAVSDVSALCAFYREQLQNVVEGCFDMRTYKVNPWTLTLMFIYLSNSPLETATILLMLTRLYL